MDNFKVTFIVDGDTVDVSPNWTWSNESGSRVRPTGYNAPEVNTIAGQQAIQKLKNLILGKTIQLGEVAKVDRGRLVCKVYFNGRDLADYFPEYQ
jgi:endonuclease YncB( thermonuclease family)